MANINISKLKSLFRSILNVSSSLLLNVVSKKYIGLHLHILPICSFSVSPPGCSYSPPERSTQLIYHWATVENTCPHLL